ncbi:MAG TPA: hypothetical protein VKH46_05400 [Thermoanaerobaculia bacterium]|nr:hypothetical protein [Thermoanaerobaculia bacterium]
MRSVFVKRSAMAGLLAIAASAAAAARAVDLAWRRMESSATGRARWIWATDDVRSPQPARFTASRSVALDADVPGARARIFVDRAYRLFLDGRLVGAGGMRPGDAMDSFALPALARGVHTMAIEAGSPTGIGGILFALDLDGAGRNAVVSDSSWKVGGRPVFVWGDPPMYPWGFPHPRR